MGDIDWIHSIQIVGMWRTRLAANVVIVDVEEVEIVHSIRWTD